MVLVLIIAIVLSVALLFKITQQRYFGRCMNMAKCPVCKESKPKIIYREREVEKKDPVSDKIKTQVEVE